MLAFALALACAVALALAAPSEQASVPLSLVSARYSVHNSVVRGDVSFSAVSVAVTLSDQIYVGGVGLADADFKPSSSNSSNATVLCVGDGVCAPLPSASQNLFGIIEMSCGDVVIRSSPSNATIPAWPTGAKLPDFFVATQPADDALAALFQSLGVASLGDTLTPKPRQLSGVVFLALSREAGPVPLRAAPLTEAALAGCTIRLVPAGVAAAQLTDASGIAFAAASAAVGMQRRAQLTCDFAALTAMGNRMGNAMNDAGNAQDFDQLIVLSWALAAYAASDAFLSCRQLAQTNIGARVAQSPSRNTTACRFYGGSPQWATDPCCNHTLAFTQCCRQRVETASVVLLSSEGIALPRATCVQPEKLEAYLSEFVRLHNAAEDPTTGCSSSSTAAADSVNADDFQNLMSFTDSCLDSLWGPGVRFTHLAGDPEALVRPPCKNDTDCLGGAKCLERFGYCSSAVYSSRMEDALWTCLFQQMPELVAKVMAQTWRLAPPPRNQSIALTDAFQREFRARYFHTNCVGGWAAFRLNFNLATVRPTYQLADKAACRDFTLCTQLKDDTPYGEASSVSAAACPDTDPNTGSTHFCGLCRHETDRGRCAELPAATRPAGCYVSASSESQCSGVFFGQTEGCWLNGVGSYLCTPGSICPKPSPGILKTHCLEAVCYSEDLTVASCNNDNWSDVDDPLLQWRPEWRNGTGLCVVTPISKEWCLKLGHSWWPGGRWWYDGFLDSEMKCSAGACSLLASEQILDTVDSRDPDSCTSQAVCSKPCFHCMSRNDNTAQWAQCSSSTQTLRQCVEALGVWDSAQQQCVHAIPGRASCEAAGYTWLSCSLLSESECRLCESQGACPLNQTVARCGIPPLGHPLSCADRSDCLMHGGSCVGRLDDLWENKAWFADECSFGSFGFLANAACGGVCTKDWSIDSEGRPYCDGPYLLLTPDGCRDYGGPLGSRIYANRTACLAAGHRWSVRPQSSADCASYGTNNTCFEAASSGETTFTQRNTSECAACGHTVSNAYPWVPPVWDQARIIKSDLVWVKRGTFRPLSLSETLNWGAFWSDLSATIVQARFAGLVRSELQCRYNPLINSLSVIACACADSGPGASGEECITGSLRTVRVGSPRFCAGNADGVRMAGIELQVDALTVSESDVCMDVGVDLVPSKQFERFRETFSSQDISSLQDRSGIYGVVRNSHNIIVGQIVSDGAQLTFSKPLAAPVTLCLDSNPLIPITLMYGSRISYFPALDFALMTPSTTTSNSYKFTPLNLPVLATSDFSRFCTSVTASGTYIAIRRLPAGWEGLTLAPGFGVGPTILLSLEAALFAFLFFASMMTFYLLVLEQAFKVGVRVYHLTLKQARLGAPHMSLTLIALFAALRCIWLAVVASGVEGMPSAFQSFLSEFPIYIMYTIFTTLIAFWLAAVSLFSPKATTIPLICINLGLYIFYVALLIAFSLVPIEDKPNVVLAYKIGISVMSIMTIVMFYITGVSLWIVMSRIRDSLEDKDHLRLHITVVIAVLSAGLVLQVAFLFGSVAIPLDPAIVWGLMLLYYAIAEFLPLTILWQMLFSVIRRRLKSQSISISLSGGVGPKSRNSVALGSLVSSNPSKVDGVVTPRTGSMQVSVLTRSGDSSDKLDNSDMPHSGGGTPRGVSEESSCASAMHDGSLTPAAGVSLRGSDVSMSFSTLARPSGIFPSDGLGADESV